MKKPFKSKIIEQLEDIRKTLVTTCPVSDEVMWEINAATTGVESAIMHWKNAILLSKRRI